MNLIGKIGSLLKISYRIYSHALLKQLQEKGFNDLRPSFLEILIVISDKQGASLKEIGEECFLKKQTMTSHINELVKRGYVKKVKGEKDRREQRVFFTELGDKFQMSLKEEINNVQEFYLNNIGEIELLKIQNSLTELIEKTKPKQK